MKIVEIFSSIEGEGRRSGYPCTFIRTYGCNCRCSFCDTPYSYNDNDYQELDIETIVNECKKYGNKLVTFTGGEPLLQEDAYKLITRLIEAKFEVNVETNGAVDLEKFYDLNCDDLEIIYPDKLMFTMDYKCPSSGMSHKMILNNIEWLSEDDVIKFVVGNIEDLEQMKHILSSHSVSAEVFVSPVFGKIELTDIVDFVKNNNLQQVRIQIQLHKIIWDVSQRGV